MKKKRQPVPRRNCSSKLGHSTSHCLPLLWEETYRLPHHHHKLGDSFTPSDARGATDRRSMKRIWTLGTQNVSNPKVPSYRGHRRYGSGVAQPSEPVVFERNRVQRAETLRLTIVDGNYYAPLPKEVREADLRPLLGTFDPSYIYASIRIKWRSTLTMIFSYTEHVVQP